MTLKPTTYEMETTPKIVANITETTEIGPMQNVADLTSTMQVMIETKPELGTISQLVLDEDEKVEDCQDELVTAEVFQAPTTPDILIETEPEPELGDLNLALEEDEDEEECEV